MVQNLPPDNEEERKQWRDQMLIKHHADIQRLWKRLNQFPQDFIGAMPHAEDAFGTATTGTSE